MAVGEGEGLGVGLGLALALGVGVGVVSGVGLGDGLGLGLVKITFIPSSGTGETTFFCPTINQPKRITSKTITNPATRYLNLFPCCSIINHYSSFLPFYCQLVPVWD